MTVSEECSWIASLLKLCQLLLKIYKELFINCSTAVKFVETERNKKKTEIISASQSSQQKSPQMKEQKSSRTSSDYSAHSL